MIDRAGVRLIVFDWAGTLVDHGSRAPATAFVEAFAGFGVTATEAEARAPMGLPKRAHIAAMLRSPSIRSQWRAAQGAGEGGGDDGGGGDGGDDGGGDDNYDGDGAAVEAIYRRFAPLTAAIAARYAAPIPGVAAALATLRRRGVMIGSTTGYARQIMAGVLPPAAAAGVAPDCVICADEVAAGRPAPDGVLANMAHFGLTDPARVLKIDDTAPGIAEGVAAGAGAVGVTLTGNGAALTAGALAALGFDQIAKTRARAARPLIAAGAEATLDSVADLPNWLEGR